MMLTLLHSEVVATGAVCVALSLAAATALYVASRIGHHRDLARARRMAAILDRVEDEATSAAQSVVRPPRIRPRRAIVKPQRPVVPEGHTLTHDGTLIKRAS